MNGRKGSLPALLALSVAAAIGSGSFAPASYSITPLPSTFTASWTCTAAMHQDWQCSAEPGKPYTENLEQIADKRSTLRGTFANLMQQTLRNTQAPEAGQIAEKGSREQSASAPVMTQSLAGSTPEESKPDTEQTPEITDITEQVQLTRSMTDNDWIKRLSSRSSWPENQTSLPEPEQERIQPHPSGQGVSEEEVSRSVLLTNWMYKARHRASRTANETADEPASDRVDNHSPVVSNPSPKEQPALKENRHLHADDWLEKAEQHAAWPEPEMIEPGASTDIPDDEQADSPNMTLVSSITMQEEEAATQSRRESSTPLTPEEQQAGAAEPATVIAQTEHEMGAVHDWVYYSMADSTEPPHDEPADSLDMTLPSRITIQGEAQGEAQNGAQNGAQQSKTAESAYRFMGFGNSLLAHQASSLPPSYKGGIAPPVSVKSAQLGMPSFQMQMKQAQEFSPMQPSEPLPLAAPPQWLPNLEVTPAERLAKAYPKQNQNPRRYMPWQQNVTPEQWKNAPSGTAMPDYRSSNPRSASAFITPDDIPLPGSQSAQLPPSPQSETAQASTIGTSTIGKSWSLSGQAITYRIPDVVNPVSDPIPDPVSAHTPEDENWPAPQYTASNRLAPKLPSYTSKPTWPGAQSTALRSARGNDTTNSPQRSLQTYRRPPPVSPKDIYTLASAQEPTSAGSAGSAAQRAPSPFHKAQRQDPEGQSSLDRFRESTREPDTVQPQPYKSQPSQPSGPAAYPPGLQHASITSQGQHKASVSEMLQAPENSFSVQWLATMQPAHITRLKQRYPLLNEATVVRFLSNGQTWYLLLSGIFPDIPSAMTYLRTEEFRDMTKQLNPWTRPLTGLNKLDLIPTDAVTDVATGAIPAKPAVTQKALPQGQYTIQWLSADNPSVLQDIRNRFPQLSNAEVVMVNRSNKVRYLLIQGRYQSHQDVIDALKAPDLSPLSAQMKPKARPMASLKNNTSVIRKPVFTQVSVPLDRQTSQILNAPEGSFTIQWLAAHKPRILEKMKARYPTLNSAETIYFRRHEKDWYVLIQGQYPTYRDAMNALNAPQLQKLTGKLKPWTRKISGLRNVAGS